MNEAVIIDSGVIPPGQRYANAHYTQCLKSGKLVQFLILGQWHAWDLYAVILKGRWVLGVRTGHEAGAGTTMLYSEVANTGHVTTASTATSPLYQCLMAFEQARIKSGNITCLL